jgi:hypothetical protein
MRSVQENIQVRPRTPLMHRYDRRVRNGLLFPVEFFVRIITSIKIRVPLYTFNQLEDAWKLL